jgi:hypothetical protein
MRLLRCLPPTVAAAALLAGCAVTTADGTRLGLASGEFRTYFERVFRDQNKVASDLAFAVDDATAAGGSPPAELAAAEDGLLQACAGVNQLATSRRDQEDLGVRKSASAARSAPDCERATRAAQAALERRAR